MGMIWRLLRRAVEGFFNDNGLQLAAAMAFYAVLSLAPATMLLLGVAGRVWDAHAAEDELVRQVETWVGTEGGQVLRTIARQANKPGQPGLGAAFGLATLLVAGTAVFVHLQAAMNAIWNVQPRPGQIVRRFLRKRWMSLLMLIVLGLLMIASLLFTWGVQVALRSLHTDVAEVAPALRLVNLLLSLVIFTLLFAVMFKILPDARVPWRYVWIGGLVTAVLFAGGRELIAVLLRRSSTASAYGAAGSLVVVLLWVYYSAVIVFFGAEFTQALVAEHGGAEPEDDAERAHPERPA